MFRSPVDLHGPVSVCYNMYSDFKAFWLHPDSANMVYEIGWQLPKEARASIDPVGDVKWTEQSGPNKIHFKTGHSISIVGYGSQPSKETGEMIDYWICRNSWGRPSNTYASGFFKIRRGINCSAIEADVAAPRVKYASASGMHKATMAFSSECTSKEVRLTRPNAPALAFLFIVALFLALMLMLR